MNLVLPTLLCLTFLLSLATVQAEPHAPIIIESTTQMLVPDALSGNGVRSGTGTAQDPWVISDWEIESPPGGAAVSLSGIDGYVVIRDLDLILVQEPGGSRFEGHGIVAKNVQHVALSEVTTSGVGAAIYLQDTPGYVSNIHLHSWTDGTCVRAVGAALTLNNWSLGVPCGHGLLGIEDANFQGSNIHARDLYAGIGAIGEGAFVLEDSSLLTKRRPVGPDRIVRDAELISIHASQKDVIRLDDVRLGGARVACLAILGPAQPSATISLSLHASACGESTGQGALRLEDLSDTVTAIAESTFTDNQAGIVAHDARVEIHSTLFAGNRVGIAAQDHSLVPANAVFTVAQSTFGENQVHLDMGLGGRATVTSSWLDSDAVRGDVTVRDSVAQPPVAWEEPGEQASALSAAACVAALLALTRRRQ